MITGTHKDTEIADELDADGELYIEPTSGSSTDWLTRDMAIDVIKHLSKVFDIAIAEAQE